MSAARLELVEPTHDQVRLEERIRRVRALLETRFDYLPTVRSSMPDSDRKPADSGTVPCGVCRGRGRVFYGKGKPRPTRICLGCDGAGQRRRRVDDPLYDMNLEPAARRLTLNGRARSMSAREYDDTIARLKADEEARRGRLDHERYGWERAREARDDAGSYRELDRAVSELHRRLPGKNVLAYDALYFLQSLMGKTIRLPAVLHAELADERRRVALELHRRHGWTAGEIARALMVSREKVGRMLKPTRM